MNVQFPTGLPQQDPDISPIQEADVFQMIGVSVRASTVGLGRSDGEAWNQLEQYSSQT